MSNAFFYLERTELGFRINLTNFNGQTILLGKEVEAKHDYKKNLQSLKTHLCFQTNYSRVRNLDDSYAFEVRTCWDELIGESISFATRLERDNAMDEIFSSNKVAELREIALQPYLAQTSHIHWAS
jgi:hypothetical protein